MNNIKKKKIGIYGGTFDPPHNGHVYSAKKFIDAMALDRLIIIPTYIPPHKSIDANDNPAIRLEMAEAAFSDIDKIQISDYEINKADVSYTIDTLEFFSNEATLLYLYCGSDMFITLDKWKRPMDIMNLADIVCIKRGRIDDKVLLQKKIEYEKKYGARIKLLDIPVYPVSSTDIREKLKLGEDVSDLLPETVCSIIKKYNLYAL